MIERKRGAQVVDNKKRSNRVQHRDSAVGLSITTLTSPYHRQLDLLSEARLAGVQRVNARGREGRCEPILRGRALRAGSIFLCILDSNGTIWRYPATRFLLG